VGGRHESGRDSFVSAERTSADWLAMRKREVVGVQWALVRSDGTASPVFKSPLYGRTSLIGRVRYTDKRPLCK
jgi:hypothetical protein